MSSFYCSSYELLFVYELPITVLYTSYAFEKFVCYSYVWSFFTWKMFRRFDLLIYYETIKKVITEVKITLARQEKHYFKANWIRDI